MRWKYRAVPILQVDDAKREIWPFIHMIHIKPRTFTFDFGWHSYGETIALDRSRPTKSPWVLFQGDLEKHPSMWLSMDGHDASYHIIDMRTKGGVVLTRFVDMVDFLTEGATLREDLSTEIGLIDWLSKKLSPSSDRRSRVRSYRSPQAS